VTRPSISIVTAAYNAAETIEETLASVRAQGYPGLEHVVVDGGSTDGTVDILRRAEGIRFVSEPDDGLADAMNKGIAMARGEIVGWLNADDLLNAGALDVVGRAAAQHPQAEWIVGRCRIIDEDGAEVRRAVTAYKNALLSRYSFRLFLTQNFVSCPAVFMRAGALREIGGGPVDTRYRNSVDYDLYLRLARRSDPVVLDDELAAFRLRADALSTLAFDRQFAEHAEQARRYGAGHPVAVSVNRTMSTLIPLVYKAMWSVRRPRAARA
jgi:glycosyltransferase involved in cell wall biosynthesis